MPNKVLKYKDMNGNEQILKKGMIVYTSWGYDQTNIDYYKVLKIEGKKYFRMRKLQEKVTETGFMSGHCVPIMKFDPAFPEVVRGYKDKFGNLTVTIDRVRMSVRAWDGKPKGCSWYA